MPVSLSALNAFRKLLQRETPLVAEQAARAAPPGWAPAPAPQLAKPAEQRMLQGMYRGYTGEAPGEYVYHAGANFKGAPNPGLFTNPDINVVREFGRRGGAERLHKFEAKPRRSGTDEDVYEIAKRLGVYDPGVPAGQYLEQGVYDAAPDVIEELRNQGLDSILLKDGMGKRPSLVALDPEVLTPAGNVFVSPQKQVADYYAQKRAAQTGETPHAEMVMIDPATGRSYGHSTAGTGAKPPISTQARELKPEEVLSRTQLYARGGLAQVKECACHGR